MTARPGTEPRVEGGDRRDGRDLRSSAAAPPARSAMARTERPRPRRSPAVRRAVDYIHAHARERITLADVAAAAGTGPRALQYAFRRQRGSTPMSYARGVRLEHAHRELAELRPGETIADIARRWGWSKPGAFAAAYRERYGRTPRQTARDPAR